MSILEKLSPKLHVRKFQDHEAYLFWCPPCQRCHVATTKRAGQPSWSFNGNVDSPSFTPSLKMTAPPSNYCCHIIVTNGRIQYCGDCNHDLKGTTIDMVPIPEGYST